MLSFWRLRFQPQVCSDHNTSPETTYSISWQWEQFSFLSALLICLQITSKRTNCIQSTVNLQCSTGFSSLQHVVKRALEKTVIKTSETWTERMRNTTNKQVKRTTARLTEKIGKEEKPQRHQLRPRLNCIGHLQALFFYKIWKCECFLQVFFLFWQFLFHSAILHISQNCIKQKRGRKIVLIKFTFSLKVV